MSWKEQISEYFTFSKKDRIGLLTLLFLVAFAAILPLFFPEMPNEEPEWLEEIASLEDSLVRSGPTAIRQSNPRLKEEKFKMKGELFLFDPNILDASGWSKLGLPERNIKTIMNYRSRGGKFYKPEDLQKIWGIPPGFYEAVKNHIQINHPNKNTAFPFIKFEKQKSPSIPALNINSADSAAFEKLPGIGPRLATRIKNFRDNLGGFYNADQVAEVYGLPDSTFQKILPYLQISGEVRKININTATKEELSRHPYIRWKMANAITEYRKQHGDFSRTEDLKKIFLIDEAVFTKMHPYLDL